MLRRNEIGRLEEPEWKVAIMTALRGIVQVGGVITRPGMNKSRKRCNLGFSPPISPGHPHAQARPRDEVLVVPRRSFILLAPTTKASEVVSTDNLTVPLSSLLHAQRYTHAHAAKEMKASKSLAPRRAGEQLSHKGTPARHSSLRPVHFPAACSRPGAAPARLPGAPARAFRGVF